MVIVSNIRLVTTNLGDTSTLTLSSGSVSASLPLTNIQKYNNSRVTRFTAPATSIIDGDLVNGSYISSFVLWRHTLTTSADWQILVYDQLSLGGNLVYDSGVLPVAEITPLNELDWGVEALGASVDDSLADVGRDFSVDWFTPVLARSFRIVIHDAGHPAGYFDIARLYMGLHIEPLINLSYDMKFGWDESTKQTRTSGGSLWSEAANPYRGLDFSLEELNETERPIWLDALLTVGKRQDFFMSVYPETGGRKERDHSFAAKFVTMPPLDHNFFENYEVSFQVEEA